jgi:integrase
MASIFKRKNGGKNWLIKFKDEWGKWRIVAGYSDKERSRQRAQMLEFEAEQRRRGAANVVTPSDMLDDHIAAYKRHLFGRTDDYIKHTTSRINAFEFEKVSDLFDGHAADRVNTVLETLSASTANHYLTAIRAFCRWLHKFRKLPLSPILELKKRKVKEIARKRRAGTDEEIERLLGHLKGKSYGLTAEQRNWLYRTALETGFRARELASLNPADFGAKIHLEAKASKDGEVVDQPVSKQFAKSIAPWIKSIKTERVWPGAWYRRGAEMLAVDLKAARVPVETKDGVLDFHSLRTTYITGLARAGVHPKIAQKLARHCTSELTMAYYTKFNQQEIESAVEKAAEARTISAPSVVSFPVRSRPRRSA